MALVAFLIFRRACPCRHRRIECTVGLWGPGIGRSPELLCDDAKFLAYVLLVREALFVDSALAHMIWMKITITDEDRCLGALVLKGSIKELLMAHVCSLAHTRIAFFVTRKAIGRVSISFSSEERRWVRGRSDCNSTIRGR